MDETQRALAAAHRHAERYLATITDRPVGTEFDFGALAETLGTLPDTGSDAEEVIDRLAELLEPGIVAMSSPRFFGFVIGGTLPAAMASDWLVSVWDQNTGLLLPTPATTTAENVAGAWLLDLLGLPADASFGFVTGCQMAHWTCLAAARHDVLARVGWDVERKGLVGAPPIRVVAGADRHVTVDRALRYLGIGLEAIEVVPDDDQGRIDIDALGETLSRGNGPTIVCGQAGNINAGAFDDLDAICDAAREVGAWVHVDGAFGLFAAATPEHAPLLKGVERADSWATDAHKLLNVPYDCGFAATAHPESHMAACQVTAAYLERTDTAREPMHFNPEFSRRARSLPVLAALMQLGRTGVEAMVRQMCDAAASFGRRLDAAPDVEVINDVVFDQVLARFRASSGRDKDHDRLTNAVIEAVQREGTCYPTGTSWHGMELMRISVASWRTTEADVERSVDAILRVSADCRADS